MVDLPVAVGVSLVLASAFLVKRLSDSTPGHAGRRRHAIQRAGSDYDRQGHPGRGAGVSRLRRIFFRRGGQVGDRHSARAGGLPEILILRMR